MPRGALDGVREGGLCSCDGAQSGRIGVIPSQERTQSNRAALSAQSGRVSVCPTIQRAVGAYCFLHDRRGQFPRSGLVLWRARLYRRGRSAQREPRLSLSGAASQMSKARMPRCGSGSGTNPPVFSGRNTGKSLKPLPEIRPAIWDGNTRPTRPWESLAPVRLHCDFHVPQVLYGRQSSAPPCVSRAAVQRGSDASVSACGPRPSGAANCRSA